MRASCGLVFFIALVMVVIIPVAIGLAAFEAWKPTPMQITEAVRHQNAINEIDEARRLGRLPDELVRDRLANVAAGLGALSAALGITVGVARMWVTRRDMRADPKTGLFPIRPLHLTDAGGNRWVLLANPNQMPEDIAVLRGGEAGWERMPALPPGVPLEYIAEAARQGKAVQAYRAMVSSGKPDGGDDWFNRLGSGLADRVSPGPVHIVDGEPNGLGQAIHTRLGLPAPVDPVDPPGWHGDPADPGLDGEDGTSWD